jgi:hypothetical protein
MIPSAEILEKEELQENKLVPGVRKVINCERAQETSSDGKVLELDDKFTTACKLIL